MRVNMDDRKKLARIPIHSVFWSGAISMGHQTLGSTFGAANRQEQREGDGDREGISRRCMLGRSVAGMLALGGLGPSAAIAQKAPDLSPRPWVPVRGIYGGYLDEMLDR